METAIARTTITATAVRLRGAKRPKLAKITASHNTSTIRKEGLDPIAAVHEAAARCQESGKPEALCMDELAKACKGIAYGKYCGMKHD